MQGFVGHDVCLYSVCLHVCVHMQGPPIHVYMSATRVLCMKTNVCALHTYPWAMSMCMCVHVCENMLCVSVHTCMQARSLSGEKEGSNCPVL